MAKNKIRIRQRKKARRKIAHRIETGKIIFSPIKNQYGR